MMQVFGIAAVCLLLAVFLKSQNKMFALLVTIGGAVLIFLISSDAAYNVFDALAEIEGSAGYTGTYVTMMLKVLGISIVTQVVCDICRDNGENALASQTEIASKIMVLAMLLPLFQTVIQIVTGLVK